MIRVAKKTVYVKKIKSFIHGTTMPLIIFIKYFEMIKKVKND